MVIIRTPDGATGEYRLRQTANGFRLDLRCTSYDLMTMLEAGWQIVGTGEPNATSTIIMQRSHSVRF